MHLERMKYLAVSKHVDFWSSLVAQQVKNPALSLLQLDSLLWHRFNPWPKNFHIMWSWSKKKKKGLDFSINLKTSVKDDSHLSDRAFHPHSL